MPAYTTADIRNITFLGHGGAGKTTLVEHLLEIAGVIQKAGTVEAKNTVCDFEDEEHHHGHSLSCSIVHFDRAGKHVNLIDTPGMPDFIGQAIITLPAVETAAIVVDATKGVQNITRRMMTQTSRRKLPHFIIVNKIDHDEVDLPAVVENIQQSFGEQCLPINLPAKGATEVVDVFDHESGEADFSSVAQAHTAIVDQVVEVDDAVLRGDVAVGLGTLFPVKLAETGSQALGALYPPKRCPEKGAIHWSAHCFFLDSHKTFRYLFHEK